jgi:hypothetical protein
MSSFFDEASLVMIPSGYKDQKVYSVKPTDGTGDLTFSRASSATRVASDGLIEKVRTNLVLQSETFDNASWIKFNSTVTANQTISPDGTNNADKLAASVATILNPAEIIQTTTQSVSTAHSYSVYAKKSTSNFIVLRLTSVAGNPYAWFNLDTGTIGTVQSGITASIVNAGNGWYRCTVVGTSQAVIAVNRVDLSVSDNNGTFVCAINGSIFIYGAQLEVSDFGATDYIATTTAAVSVGPVSGLPRLDYLGSTCPRLILEGQRTNDLTYSEQLNNAAWSVLDNVSVSANVSATLDPSGYNGADKLVENSANDQHRIYRSIGGAGATFSFFAKAAERSWIAVLSNNGNFTYFNIGNGTLGTIAATSTAKITPYGNGWYRCEIYNTHASFGSLIQLVLANNGTSYLGDGTSGAYIWGCQVEASAAYATSYIPTLGASVTRVADAASKTGISSLIGQTEGTLFVDLSEVNDLDFPEITIDDNTNNNRIVLTRSAVNGYWGIFTASAGTGVSGYGTTAGNSGKLALAYSAAGYVLYRNGVQVATASAALPVSLSAIRLNGRATSDFFATKKVAQTLLFKTRLTNAQLAELTA